MSPLSLLPLALSLALTGQSTQGIQPLQPDTPVERELAGGESHIYQITLSAGQFVRFRLEQRAIDSALVLVAPDGTQLAEMNMTTVGEQESLAVEAAVPGDYRLTVRSVEADTWWRGSYRLDAAVHAPASAQDRRHLAAQALMVEAAGLHEQGASAAPQAIERLERALAMWRELQEPSWIALSLCTIAAANADRGEHEKAIGLYEQALAVCRASALRAREGYVLRSLGAADYALGRYDKAIELHDQALTIEREVRDRRGEAEALNGLAIDSQTIRRMDKAVEYHEQTLTILRELKEREGEAWTLQGLASAYMSLSRSEEASATAEQALGIFRELKNRRGEGAILQIQGMISLSLSRYEKAIDDYEQALAITREQKDREEEGWLLDSLGGVYAGLKRYDKAIELIEQALAIDREVKNRVGEGRALLDLGSVYTALGRSEKAVEVLEQALVVNRETQDVSVEGYTLGALGSASASLGRSEKAIDYYEQALAVNRKTSSRPQEGSTLNRLADVYRSLKQYDTAIEYSGRALAISREVKNPEYEVNALASLARTESDRGNLEGARSRVEECLQVAESLRSREIVSPTSRAAMLAAVQRSYQLYTDVLMRQHAADPTKGLDALAVEVSERQRARTLLDLLAEAGTDVRQGVDPTLVERERTLSQQLNAKARTVTKTPDEAAALDRDISQLETDLERAQVALRENSPHYAALVQPRPLELAEIQQQLDPDTVLLEYSLGDERSYLWAITSDSLSSFVLPKGEQIDQRARAVYELLTARSAYNRGESGPERLVRVAQAEARLPAAAEALSRMVLAPVADRLGGRRLVIVADGALQYIPFAMLPDPAVGNRHGRIAELQPLIVGHEVVSLASASALAVQRKELAGRQPAPKTLAVIADPVFDRADTRFGTPAPKTSDVAQLQTVAENDERTRLLLVEAPGAATRRLIIPRLPFTRQEANRLLALAPKGSSFRAMDFDASRATVLGGELSHYRYVHFATHGLLDSERPGLSSLVLSTVDAQGKPQDGFLRANDIYNLKLDADLVVLSACQTGLGKDVKGEGLIGLTRGFMYAGAARVVVSLWSVNDQATSDLMARFYEKMLKQNERPAAALRAAQVAMWKQRRWQSPYYWSAFVLQGEWQ